MTTAFDQHGINDATVAISLEMAPRGRGRHPDADMLFMGGPRLRDVDRRALSEFGLRKNYKVVFASFDPADPHAGPVAIEVAVNDGVGASFVVVGGRLWKRDRRSPAVLLFPTVGALVEVSSKGRLAVREMNGQYHDQGYGRALKAVRARASLRPGGVPVLSPVGDLMTVLDMGTLAATFEAA